MYFCGLFNLDEWNDDAKYAVFDDINWKFFPNWKPFFGSQKRFTVTDKYRKKRTVNWGRPCIVLGNEDDTDPTRVVSRAELDWIDLNCDIVRLSVPLFE